MKEKEMIEKILEVLNSYYLDFDNVKSPEHYLGLIADIVDFDVY